MTKKIGGVKKKKLTDAEILENKKKEEVSVLR
jgi:hypothetical protein